MQPKTSSGIRPKGGGFLLATVYGLALALVALVTGGCEGETGVAVTGAGSAADDSQSETAVVTTFANGESFVVVAYNDHTDDPQVTFDEESRLVKPGASLMGWSYSKDRGQTWTYGGRVKPPEGWAVLWGDPALTVDRSAVSYVFMSNVAIPDSKSRPTAFWGRSRPRSRSPTSAGPASPAPRTGA